MQINNMPESGRNPAFDLEFVQLLRYGKFLNVMAVACIFLEFTSL
jgi:hypothetical protein